MSVTTRLEDEGDHREVENMVRGATRDVYKPGCDEHLVPHNPGKSPAYVRKLHLLACAHGKIVRSVVYSKPRGRRPRRA